MRSTLIVGGYVLQFRVLNAGDGIDPNVAFLVPRYFAGYIVDRTANPSSRAVVLTGFAVSIVVRVADLFILCVYASGVRVVSVKPVSGHVNRILRVSLMWVDLMRVRRIALRELITVLNRGTMLRKHGRAAGVTVVMRCTWF